LDDRDQKGRSNTVKYARRRQVRSFLLEVGNLRLARDLSFTTLVLIMAITAIAFLSTHISKTTPADAGSSIPSAGELASTSLVRQEPVIPTIVPASVRQPVASAATFPLIPTSLPELDILALTQPSLDAFIASLPEGRPDELLGVYAPGVMALMVEPQPPGQDLYVTSKVGYATLFSRPLRYNVIALLAHNTHSGALFYKLDLGDAVTLVYGDGRREVYQIEAIEDFQKLEPGNPRSNYVELISGQVMSTRQVFTRFYRNGPHLVLQTCLEYQGNYNWGVRFIMGEEIND
jgi:hypothetical protein